MSKLAYPLLAATITGVIQVTADWPMWLAVLTGITSAAVPFILLVVVKEIQYAIAMDDIAKASRREAVIREEMQAGLAEKTLAELLATGDAVRARIVATMDNPDDEEELERDFITAQIINAVIRERLDAARQAEAVQR